MMGTLDKEKLPEVTTIFDDDVLSLKIFSTLPAAL